MLAVMPSEEPPAYVARYGWTRVTPLGLMLSIAMISVGYLIFLSPRLIVPFGLVVAGGVYLLAGMLGGLLGRQVAFQVDHSGVTLGGNPFRYRATTRHIQWDDIQQVTLYTREVPLVFGKWRLGTAFRYKCIGLVRQPDAPALSRGGRFGWLLDRPAYGGPPDIAGGAARAIGAWNLDHARLELAVSTFAPGIPVVELTPSPRDRDHDPGYRPRHALRRGS